ncbi:MAG: hypothetical protein JWP25_6034 [Bradyrhizobium sp.]|nr:hypothetical protein [Bradyrhizobium sp.]
MVTSEIQIGLPYRIDETQPRDDNAAECDSEYLERFGREKTHPDNMRPTFVERVAA